MTFKHDYRDSDDDEEFLLVQIRGEPALLVATLHESALLAANLLVTTYESSFSSTLCITVAVICDNER